MIGLIVKVLGFFTKAKSVLGFFTPRNILFRRLISNRSALRAFSKALNITPKRLINAISKGELNKLLRKINKLNPQKAQRILSNLNGFINKAEKRERLKTREIQQNTIKQARDQARLQKKLGENEQRSRSGTYIINGETLNLQDRQLKRTIRSGLDAINTKQKQEIREINNIQKTIIHAFFISSWTHEGIYNKQTRFARLRHQNKWYDYPNFPYKWFVLMANGIAPYGLGAGSVWWAKYKRNGKAVVRVKGNKALAKYW